MSEQSRDFLEKIDPVREGFSDQRYPLTPRALELAGAQDEEIDGTRKG